MNHQDKMIKGLSNRKKLLSGEKFLSDIRFEIPSLRGFHKKKKHGGWGFHKKGPIRIYD